MKNQIIKILLLPIVFIFCTSLVQAQKEFNEAQIILKDGSTITGFIREIDDDRYTQSILFKTKKDDLKAQKLNLSALKSIVLIESRISYECREIGLMMKEEKDDNLPYLENIEEYRKKLKMDNEVFLLKKILTGSLIMYEIIDKNNQLHFIVKKPDGELVELQQIRYKRVKNNGTFIGSIDIFKDQLETLFGDCSKQYSVSTMKFNEKELLSAVKFYNQCKGSPSEQAIPKDVPKKSSLSASLIVGVSTTKTDVTSAQRFSTSNILYVLSQTTFSDFTLPTIGANFTFFPRKNKPLALIVDVLYNDFKTNGAFEESDGVIFRNYTTKFAFQSLQSNFAIRYYLPINKLKLFTNLGISNGFLINYESLFTSKKSIPSVKVVENYPDQIFLNSSNITKSSFGWSAGVGAKIGRIGAELRYVQTQGFIRADAGFQARLNSLSFLVSYQF